MRRALTIGLLFVAVSGWAQISERLELIGDTLDEVIEARGEPLSIYEDARYPDHVFPLWTRVQIGEHHVIYGYPTKRAQEVFKRSASGAAVFTNAMFRFEFPDQLPGPEIDAIWDTVVLGLTTDFGAPTRVSGDWVNEEFKGQPEELFTALAADHVDFVAEWESEPDVLMYLFLTGFTIQQTRYFALVLHLEYTGDINDVTF